MKRFGWVGAVFFLCLLFVGCASNAHEGLISDTINRIDKATTEVGIIKARVDDAVKQAETKGEALDLKEAIAATKTLKDTGVEMQQLKGRIEQIRSQITDEERKKNAETYGAKLNSAFSDLHKKKEELRVSLAAAEKLSKKEVKTLRDKITEAEGPFEQLTH